MIKAVLIDIDNTLLDFDTHVKNTMQIGFEKFGLGCYEDWMFSVFGKVNNKLWQKIEQGTLTFEQLMHNRWNEVFAELGITFDGVRFEEYFRECLFYSAVHIDGAVEILEYLKEKYILCAAGNGPYNQQVNRLKEGKMLQYFSKVFLSEKIGASKPSKEFFEHCLNEINSQDRVLPCEIIMIGDSLTSDIQGAVNSGMKTCFFDRKHSGNTNGLPIDYVINKLTDIREIL